MTHWNSLADKMEEKIARDQQTVEWTLQQLLEAGQYSWIEGVCKEWLAKVSRKDMVG